jgi:hypothetical protein
MSAQEVLDTLEAANKATVKETLNTLNEASDTIEDTLDILDNMDRANKISILVAAFMTFAGGALLGYLIAKKRTEAKYARLMEKEIEKAKEFYSARQKIGEFADPVKLAEKYVQGTEMEELRELTRDYRSDEDNVEGEEVKDTEESEEGVVVVSNDPLQVFTSEEPDPNWNYEAEIRNRTEEAPYVISHDEFMASEKDYSQSVLTYYESDDVLADEQDKPVENTDRVVGDYNLQRFGHGSKDNNVVYIRNEVLEHEFEVIRNRGSYVEQVLGFISHSARRRPLRKFRSDDE